MNNVGIPIDTSRVPIAMRERGIIGVSGHQQTQQRVPDFRRYEIKDHLGNVRTVIADYKNPDNTTGAISAWTYLADVKNISNMYPYGKSYGTNAIYNASEDYRYGFNGMEKEKNLSASGDITDFGARVFDANFPTFLSRDPLEAEFAYQSPFLISENNPILKIDVNGEWAWVINNWFESYSNTNINLVNAINQIMKQEQISFKSLITYNIKGIQDKLNEYNKKWSNPNYKSYSPKVAAFLKNEQINVVIGDLSNMKDDYGGSINVLGVANENNMVMFIDQEQFKQTYGTNEQALEATFLHEIVHLMGGGEFQAFSATLVSGLTSESEIRSYFNKESSLLYLLEGSGIKLGEFFTLADHTDALLFDDEAVARRPYKLMRGKEKEFFDLMRETGKKYIGEDNEE